MPRQTQTYPRALVDLLQLKDPSPMGLEDNYRAALEMIDIIGTERATVFSTSSATFVGGSTASQLPLTIPDGQVWVMVAAGGYLSTTDVGDISQVWIEHQRAGRQGPPLATSAKQTATLAGERNTVGFTYPRPTILVPGDTIRLRVMYETAAGGPATGVLVAEYYRFGPDSLGSAL